MWLQECHYMLVLSILLNSRVYTLRLVTFLMAHLAASKVEHRRRGCWPRLLSLLLIDISFLMKKREFWLLDLHLGLRLRARGVISRARRDLHLLRVARNLVFIYEEVICEGCHSAQANCLLLRMMNFRRMVIFNSLPSSLFSEFIIFILHDFLPQCE